MINIFNIISISTISINLSKYNFEIKKEFILSNLCINLIIKYASSEFISLLFFNFM